NSNLYKESIPTIHKSDIAISGTSMQSLGLTPCVVIDITQGEIKRCNSTMNLWHLWQIVETWEIDVDAVKDVENSFSEEPIARKSHSDKRITCTELEKHHNDTKDALRLIEKWLISISESDNQKLQEKFLSQISSTIFNDVTIENSSELPSKLLIRTVMRLKEVELDRLTKTKSLITPNKASMMGEKLGREILYSCSEIKQNISQLENPSSYEHYVYALSIFIRNFFQALFTVLQHKLTVINNKRRQHHEFIDQPLFGESSTTNDLLMMYETILNELVATLINEFKIKDVFTEFTKYVPIGCNIPPPNVVILEPGDLLNCNENVHAACEMYQTHNDVKLLLGQWHTSKDMCCTLITISSGYGIFNLAATLGVKYLEKFELYSKNKGITMNQILDSHKIRIKRENYRMQMANLAAFAPLFFAAGKFKYASAVAHFLAQIHDDSQLQKLLKTVCSVNLTSDGHYLAFDEALETYGVKFIKQNIIGNLTDQQTMMLKIKAAQSKRNCLSMLLAEYINNVVISQNVCAIKLRKDLLWFLATELLSVFNYPNPTIHFIFEDVPKTSEDGIKNILSFYESRKSCFQQVLAEDVYKTEILAPECSL
ncbi:19873_t:CDS:2, partial [Cetraspora pellucida]